MSDESPRSAHGNPPHQGWGEGIPSWWSELERSDLPDDPLTPRSAARAGTGTARRAGQSRRERDRVASLRMTSGGAPFASRPSAHAQGPIAFIRHRLGNAATLALVLVAAVLATWIGLGDASARGLLVVVLVFGVPTILTMLAVSLVVRRGGR